MNRGVLVIGVILLLGVAAGGTAVWYHHTQQHRSLDFWGIEAATTIRHPKSVAVLRLQAMTESSVSDDVLQIENSNLLVLGSIDISDHAGLLHARHALIEDASFDWSRGTSNQHPKWECGLRFKQGESDVNIVLDFVHAELYFVERQRRAPFNAKILRALQRFTIDVLHEDGES